MVSAAYSDMAINIRNFVGVKYPSVKTDYQGHNVVLTPMAVENNLELLNSELTTPEHYQRLITSLKEIRNLYQDACKNFHFLHEACGNCVFCEIIKEKKYCIKDGTCLFSHFYRKYNANPNIIPIAISCQFIFSIFNKVKKILSSFGIK